MKEHSETIHTTNLLLHSIAFGLYLALTVVFFTLLIFFRKAFACVLSVSLANCDKNGDSQKVEILLIVWLLYQLAQYTSEIVLCWIMWEIGRKSDEASEESGSQNG